MPANRLIGDPLHEFKSFVDQAGLASKLAVVFPAAAPAVPPIIAVAATSPLWPESALLISSIAAFAFYVLETVIYVVAFHFLHRCGKPALSRWLWSLAIAT